jgi:type III restriction enzyme
VAVYGPWGRVSGRQSQAAGLLPLSKRAAAKSCFGQEWIEENKFINDVRHIVGKWRLGNYDGVTNTTRHLLGYWRRPERDKRLYFCQIEATETAIYLAEVADRKDAAWILRDLKLANQDTNPLLKRIAFKMATGSGKTVVMAMLIAWQALNKLARPLDTAFLIPS